MELNSVFKSPTLLELSSVFKGSTLVGMGSTSNFVFKGGTFLELNSVFFYLGTQVPFVIPVVNGGCECSTVLELGSVFSSVTKGPHPLGIDFRFERANPLGTDFRFQRVNSLGSRFPFLVPLGPVFERPTLLGLEVRFHFRL